jgi:hypothetical protein
LNLTEEQILTLAPDESSKKAGKDLANPSKWVSKGVNEKALWGECQGSGSKPYQTQIDLNNIAFKCSCPSRKFPCKHGLGLLLLYARQTTAFNILDTPPWVADWLSKRVDKLEKKETKEDKPIDEAAQAKRKQARQLKVEDGIAELRLWIRDIIRNGIASIPEKGLSMFDNMAKRMVDAQAPGLANMVRQLSEVSFFEEDWQSKFLDRLLSIFLVLEGYKNQVNLSPLLQQDIRSLVGFTQNQEELKAHSAINDTWLILSKQVTEVDNITTERNWLYGKLTNQYALVLQFIVRGQGAQHLLTAGMYVQAALIYYPSILPLRAIIQHQIAGSSAETYSGFENWDAITLAETNYNSVLPVRGERPFIIIQVKPIRFKQLWWLQDAEQKMMRMKNEQKIIWKLLALSGGNPLDMVVIGKEDQFEPVGVWHNKVYKIL